LRPAAKMRIAGNLLSHESALVRNLHEGSRIEDKKQ